MIYHNDCAKTTSLSITHYDVHNHCGSIWHTLFLSFRRWRQYSLRWQKSNCRRNYETLNTKKSNEEVPHSYKKRIYQPNIHVLYNYFGRKIIIQLPLSSNKSLPILKYHIGYITGRINETVGLLAKLRHFLLLPTQLNVRRY